VICHSHSTNAAWHVAKQQTHIHTMRSFLTITIAITVATLCYASTDAVSPTDDEYNDLWQEFTAKHNKVYHPHEVLNKFNTFKDNVDHIMAHNAAGTHKYKLAINQFADMSRAEFARSYLGLNAPIKKTRNVDAALESSSSPDAVDWVIKGAVTPVKNQGQCGGCWAFSTTGAVEGINQINTGNLVSLSEQELVSCASSYGNSGCNGGLMDDGFKYIMAKGDETESSYPYTSSAGSTGTCSSSKAKSANGIAASKITGYRDVTENSETALQAAVARQPVSVAIEADQSAFQFYSSGVFDSTCGSSVDHGVLLVGYGTDGGSEYWKVKNSWGTTWGEDGYIRMARNVASSAGQCGIASMASYPTMNEAAPLVSTLSAEDSWTATSSSKE